MRSFTCQFILFTTFLMSSCISSKKSTYINNMVADSIYRAVEAIPLRVQEGDRLSVVVGARSAELAAPFNPSEGYRMDDKGIVSSGMNREVPKGYLVNREGQITFPVLGNLAVSGLTLDEVKSRIRQQLIDERLLIEPTVSVELENLKINVIGEVNKVGIVSATGGRITLLDAIAAAGGLTSNGLATEVSVIREENGHRRLLLNNLESSDVFSAPGYYLQQHDIVYVKPKGRRMSPSEEANFRYTSLGIGILSLIMTVLTLLTK